MDFQRGKRGVWRIDGRVVATSTRAGRGPGWTNAHAKRVAKKRRNVLRNRLVHRRAR